MTSPSKDPASTESELDGAPFEYIPSESIGRELGRELAREPAAHDQPDSGQDDTPPWNQIPALFAQPDHLQVEKNLEKQSANTGHENSDSSQDSSQDSNHDSSHDDTPPSNRIPARFERSDYLPAQNKSQRELASNGVRALGDDQGLRRQPAFRPNFLLPASADDLKWPIVERIAILFMIVMGFAGMVVLVFSYEESFPDSVALPQSSFASHNTTLTSVKFGETGSTIVDGRSAIDSRSASNSLRQTSLGEMPTESERTTRSAVNEPIVNQPIVNQPWQSGPPANGTLFPSAVPARPARDPAVLVDNDATSRLIKRGNDFLKEGDFAAARLVFKRAADAGGAEAALALGSTYDPLVIKQLGAFSVKPDIDSALQWYAKAADLGSAEAANHFGDLMRARQTQPQH
jgi:hypothetical protein